MTPSATASVDLVPLIRPVMNSPPDPDQAFNFPLELIVQGFVTDPCEPLSGDFVNGRYV